MIRFILYGCFLLLALLSSCTPKSADKNTATNDSIKKYLDLAGNDTLDSKLRNKYNDKAFSLIDLSKNDTLIRFYLSFISVNYIKIEQYQKYKNIAKFHFEKSKKAKDTLNLARYFRYKANCFNKNAIYDSSFYYYIRAEKFYTKIDDITSYSTMQLNQGLVQFSVGDYEGSELSLLKALSFLKNSNNKDKLYGTLNQLGLVYNELAEYNKSIGYHKQALEMVKRYKLNNIQHQEAVCYNNIGYLYLNQQNYQKAIINFELGLKNKNIINDDIELYALLKSNLAYSKFKRNNLKECKELLFETLRFQNKLKGKSVMISIFLYLSEYYSFNGKNDQALLYSKKALNAAVVTRVKPYILIALKHAIITDKYNSKQNIDEYLKIFTQIQLEDRKSKARFDKIQLETDEITQEKETAIKQKWIIGTIAGVIILIIVLLLIITRQRSRQKELQFQQSQQKANEEIYDLMLTQKNKEELARQSEKKRIALELHDGVMNKLASTRLNLNVLSHHKDEETINKCLTHVEGIHKIEQEIRNIAHDLNTEIFNETNSFVTLLNDFVETQNATSCSRYILEADSSIDWIHISSEIKMNLYRIIQEASHNINKYAQASTVMISLVLDENNICLSITDNGIGFDTDAKTEGIGLKNIEQRVKSLKGKVVIQSNNKSTSINIAIPFAAE